MKYIFDTKSQFMNIEEILKDSKKSITDERKDVFTYMK